jgi:hypothetical protein
MLQRNSTIDLGFAEIRSTAVLTQDITKKALCATAIFFPPSTDGAHVMRGGVTTDRYGASLG